MSDALPGPRLWVLGAGAILPRAGYGCAGYALEPSAGGPLTLLDCGPGSVRMLGACELAPERVERVVISHFHTDHWLDLFALYFARRNPTRAWPELEVIGPVGLRARVEAARGVLGAYAVDERARVTEVELDARGRASLRRGDLEFECVRTLHAPEALAWRVELGAPDGGRASVAYSGDTGENPAVADLAAAADLFVCECSFPDAEPTEHHLTPSSAARLAARARPRRLLLSHFYPHNDPARARELASRTFEGAIDCARDGSLHALR
ncbi:MAG: ribonuclease Z [Planctomycetota bacterium]|nr:MAG: ribonuclease Z [Planctomycetota bacterium]